MSSLWSSLSFRDLSIFPSNNDIDDDDDARPFLEANIINGSYRDVEHYLKVQFCLLREDLIRPLRDKISAYKQGNTSLTYQRIHTDVQVLRHKITDTGIVYHIKFPVVGSLKHFQWENSKRLVFGSLLCFSENNFRTMAYATVVDSDSEMLRKGELIVRFERNRLKIDKNYSRPYIMVETESYFEAYRYFLQVLKEIKSKKFPLKEYIVSLCTDVKPPRYAGNTDQVYFINRLNKIRIHQELDWCRVDMNLDQSQKEAVKLALTKSLAIIQGPPGTGKTHVGLSIVQLLLVNRSVWSPENDQCPILVVCATNHALDQFLENILRYTKKIVRIGGQSKSGVLADYNLNTLKQKKKIKQQGGAFRAKRHAHNQIKSISKTILEINQKIPENHHEVICLDDLYSGIAEEDFEVFENFWESFDDDYELCYWLAGGSSNNTTFIRAWQSQGGMEAVKDIARNRLLCSPLSESSTKLNSNLWNLKNGDRWRVYKFWLEKYFDTQERKLENYENDLKAQLLITDEPNKKSDCAAVKGAQVVGMTTTGAAKFNHLIKTMRPKIVIVEEAAEVLEAHIVTSLSENTHHLILIGDHQQLRPNPTVYELGKIFNMDISLFERLIKNGFPFCRLEVQHRMRPSISRILKLHFYKNLKDHTSVLEYENIKGLEKSVFFVTHSYKENVKEDSISRINEHEIGFLIELSKYLLLQGYQPSQIVILATYNAQMNMLKTSMEGALKDIKISSVDNFQGEESDIVLISFVRSNEEGRIGFLKTENRVCVALSRAKLGLYCIGNFQLFASRSKLWREIVNDLKMHESVGPALKIKCQSHGNIIPVKCAADFSHIPNGGCGQFCNHILRCGHLCPQRCHPDYVAQHTVYKCNEMCRRIICTRTHKCPKRCWDTCEKCKIVIVKVFNTCQHTTRIPCFKDTPSLTCKMSCERYLSCGHKCTGICGEPCEKCTFFVKKVIPSCLHTVWTYCFTDINLYPCTSPCEKILECGHECSEYCFDECTRKCLFMVPVKCFCGRDVLMACWRLQNREGIAGSFLRFTSVLLNCHSSAINCFAKCTPMVCALVGAWLFLRH